MRNISRFLLVSIVVLSSTNTWASTTTKCYSCAGGPVGSPCKTADGKDGRWRKDEGIYHVCSNAIAYVGPTKTSDRLPLKPTVRYIPSGTVLPNTGTSTTTGKPATDSSTKKPSTTGTSTTTGQPQQQNQ